jgi:hypothetical protein
MKKGEKGLSASSFVRDPRLPFLRKLESYFSAVLVADMSIFGAAWGTVALIASMMAKNRGDISGMSTLFSEHLL